MRSLTFLWCVCLPMVESYQRLEIMALDVSLLNTKHYKVQIKSKWSNLGKGVVCSFTPWCSRYWKGCLRVALDYGLLTYDLFVHIEVFYCDTHTHTIWQYGDTVHSLGRNTSTKYNKQINTTFLSLTYNVIHPYWLRPDLPTSLNQYYSWPVSTRPLPGSSCVFTAVWMHDLDANKTAREEARQQLHKNVASNIEHDLTATPHKALTIRPPASHHENYQS